MDGQYPYSFGKYRMEAEIGRGGFGTVFRAEDVGLERQVAIKIMDPIYMRDQRWVARFRREARVMAKLEHPHIVPIHEIGEEEGRLYLAMKLIDGPDLTAMINENVALPWDVVVGMVSQIASALDFAHQQNVIHRDLKPANILVSNGQALLTDFGLAQMVESNSQSVSLTGGVAGTYNYMPPEVFNNEDVTPAADIYALGCVVYEMLAGHTLFDGKTTAAIIGAHLKGITLDEPLPEGTPPGTLEIIQTALAKNPEDRYATATELAEELQRVGTDRLMGPYAQLEQAVNNRQWPEAMALAADIRAYKSDYRDVAALEEQAKRGQSSEQWRSQAEQALVEDDFDAVDGALTQWRRIAPDDPGLQQFEEQLTLVQKYVTLQSLVTAQQWSEAAIAADAIYDQDPSFREIKSQRALIHGHVAEIQKQAQSKSISSPAVAPEASSFQTENEEALPDKAEKEEALPDKAEKADPKSLAEGASVVSKPSPAISEKSKLVILLVVLWLAALILTNVFLNAGTILIIFIFPPLVGILTGFMWNRYRRSTTWKRAIAIGFISFIVFSLLTFMLI